MKTIGLCSDQAGFELKEFIKQLLDSKGIAYKDFGTSSSDSCDYPDYAHPLAKAVETNEQSGWVCSNCNQKTLEWEILCPHCNSFNTVFYRP